MLVWELLGALMGAGFASGREIAAFFAQYGIWGYAGAVLAAVSLVWLADTRMPTKWRDSLHARIWHILLAALLAVTGGAMLSAAGEVAALVIPMHGAYWAGMAVTLLIAWLLARKSRVGLAWVSKMMFIVFVVVLIIGLSGLRENTADVTHVFVPEALAKGICYGGFNAALLIPIMHTASEYSEYNRKRALIVVGVITVLLLSAGNAVLQKQPSLIYETMPFVQMLKTYGHCGYYLSAFCMYLAVLSTLTACIRGLGRGYWGVVGIILVSLLGFGRVVDYAYTLLGGVCMLMLLMAKFRNCSRKAFISGEDML